MNLSLDNNVNKSVLVLVAGVVVLLLINMYKNVLGKNVSIVLSVLVIVVCVYSGYMLLNNPQENYVNPNESFSPIYEHFQDEAAAEQADAEQAAAEQAAAEQAAAEQAAAEQAAAEQAAATEQASANNASANNASANNALLNCQDLLPGDSNSTWGQNSPNCNGDITTKNLLNAGHHVGVNTQGCSMRNANRGLRSEPPNPQVQVSPWLQTTICPDLHRKPLE